MWLLILYDKLRGPLYLARHVNLSATQIGVYRNCNFFWPLSSQSCLWTSLETLHNGSLLIKFAAAKFIKFIATKFQEPTEWLSSKKLGLGLKVQGSSELQKWVTAHFARFWIAFVLLLILNHELSWFPISASTWWKKSEVRLLCRLAWINTRHAVCRSCGA